MKNFEDAKIEVIRFEAEDIVVASSPTPCDWNCKTVCPTQDCSDICTGVYNS